MAVNIQQPIWIHPTSVLLVDDEKKFLEPLITQIDSNFPTVTYTNPKEALEHLKKNILPIEKLSEEIVSEIEPTHVRQLLGETVSIQFAPLHAQLDKPTRFKKITTLIIDKVMKEMDGIDFCREVRRLGLPIKNILLTGNMNDTEAVTAFNQGVIDGFVSKTVPDMMEKINKLLNDLSFQQFCDSSAQLIGPISSRYLLLTKQEFADFLKKNTPPDTAEIYILDSSGTCLVVTKNGKTYVLLIKSLIDFKNAYDIANNNVFQNSEVLKALENKSAFPFTGIDESYYTLPAEKWKNIMAPMKKYNELNFYYTVVEISLPVLSLNHYMNEIWKPNIH